MIRWREGRVDGLGRRWHGAVELTVTVAERIVPALAYPALVGEPVPGDRVLLNVNALEAGLGTGGYALVVALPDRLPPDPPEPNPPEPAPLPPNPPEPNPPEPRPGRIVKARYTPLQPIVTAVEETHPELSTVDSLEGMPVVLADLHSALPAILAGIQAERPDAAVGYVMTDGGALPAWFSRTLAGLAGRLAGVVTVGQAFGGDLEAVTVHSGLLAARYVLGADLAVLAQGPGNLGTGTPWGFSGIAVGEAVNAVATLGGRPVGALRVSDADPRPRHRGVSHHSLTAYGRVALAPADLVVPADLVLPAQTEAALAARHRIVRVKTDGLARALRALPVPLSTMGRDLDADPGYFLAAAAAGRYAATLLDAPPPDAPLLDTALNQGDEQDPAGHDRHQ